MQVEEQLEILCRCCSDVISREELGAKLQRSLETGAPLRVKLGVDPTVPHVTLGWAVVLRKLRDFQRLGHTACLIIGDFTATIGDPSGKNKTRPQLSREEVQANVKAVEAQLYKILESDKTEVTYNADWLGAMSFADVIELASNITVARILERDDFQNRLHDERPIGLHEVLYPLCQGYDSVAIQADVELGGNDQKFNNLVGRALQSHYGQQPQVVMLTPLLVGLDGKEKMSQSLGNYIGITDEPNEMYGKTMSIPDSIIESWLTLCTDVPLEQIAEMSRALRSDELNPRDAKRFLASELVRIYHGEDAAKAADEYFTRTFSKKEQPVEAPEAVIPAELVEDGQFGVARLIAALGLSKSVSGAKRLIEGGGVEIGGERVTDPQATFSAAQAAGKVLRVGKHRFRTLKG